MINYTIKYIIQLENINIIYNKTLLLFCDFYSSPKKDVSLFNKIFIAFFISIIFL